MKQDIRYYLDDGTVTKDRPHWSQPYEARVTLYAEKGHYLRNIYTGECEEIVETSLSLAWIWEELEIGQKL